MLFLGISSNYHDSAACLVDDGQLVAAAHQERSSRIKHDPSFPRGAIATCLSETGRSLGDLDGAAFYEDPLQKMERTFLAPFAFFPRGRRGFASAISSQLRKNVFVLDDIRQHTKLPRDKVVAFEHHRSHAASAHYLSGHARTATLVIDGVGEEWTTTLWRGHDDKLSFVEGVMHPHSLGLFYAAFTAFLGFVVNSGEYKVMGLASYGEPRFVDDMAALLKLRPDGSFELDGDAFHYGVHPSEAFGPALVRRFGDPRPYGKPWNLDDDSDRRYIEIAASLQAHLEDAVLGLVRRARAATDCDALCLAGGVALNVRAVRRVVDSGLFANVFVQPAAGDAGGALGAALLLAAQHGEAQTKKMRHTALGKSIDAARAFDVATALNLTPIIMQDPAQEIASAIAEGHTVARATGRSEFGPRALGQRSILASPLLTSTRDHINLRIKRRESFRPFAPAVLASSFDHYFDGRHDGLQEFMTVTNVATDVGRTFLATTHVDGTSRAQSVAPGGALAPILNALENIGQPPCVLNTSLNGAGESICDTSEDALALLLRTPLDDLFVDDVHIRATPSDTSGGAR